MYVRIDKNYFWSKCMRIINFIFILIIIDKWIKYIDKLTHKFIECIDIIRIPNHLIMLFIY